MYVVTAVLNIAGCVFRHSIDWGRLWCSRKAAHRQQHQRIWFDRGKDIWESFPPPSSAGTRGTSCKPQTKPGQRWVVVSNICAWLVVGVMPLNPISYKLIYKETTVFECRIYIWGHNYFSLFSALNHAIAKFVMWTISVMAADCKHIIKVPSVLLIHGR